VLEILQQDPRLPKNIYDQVLTTPKIHKKIPEKFPVFAGAFFRVKASRHSKIPQITPKTFGNDHFTLQSF
jgi:hypothetical protein